MIDDCMQKVAFARYPAFGGSRSESFSDAGLERHLFGYRSRDSGDHLGGLRQQDLFWSSDFSLGLSMARLATVYCVTGSCTTLPGSGF